MNIMEWKIPQIIMKSLKWILFGRECQLDFIFWTLKSDVSEQETGERPPSEPLCGQVQEQRRAHGLEAVGRRRVGSAQPKAEDLHSSRSTRLREVQVPGDCQAEQPSHEAGDKNPQAGPRRGRGGNGGDSSESRISDWKAG